MMNAPIPRSQRLLCFISALCVSQTLAAGTASSLGLGYAHSCAIRTSDSSLVCFGTGASGALGYGSDAK
eukprot:3194-Heterococcus_DN1.PRE.2